MGPMNKRLGDWTLGDLLSVSIFLDFFNVLGALLSPRKPSRPLPAPPERDPNRLTSYEREMIERSL